MRRTLQTIVIGVGLASPVCWGQGLFDQLNFRNAERAGFGFYGVSVFAGYTRYDASSTGQIPSNTNYGASFSAGWQYHRPKTNFSVLYGGSYGGLVRYPQFNGYSQTLSLALSRQLSRKWAAALSATGQDNLLSESLFQPSSLSLVSQTTSTFDNFSAALGVGQFTTPQDQSLYQNSYLDSAVRSGLLGGRVLSYGGQASLSYSYSPHVQFHFGTFAGGGRRLAGSGDPTVLTNYAMPFSYGGNAGVSFSHPFSPRTTLSLNLDDQYTHNVYQQASISTATVSFSRKMGSRWFLRAYGGGSYTYFLAYAYTQPRSLQVVGGGSLGFQMPTHTLAASYDRSAASSYGFSVGTNTNLMASWGWHRPGGRLSLFSSYSQQQQRNTAFLSISGWQVEAGLSERLASQVSLSVQYSYLDSSSHDPARLYTIRANSARASLSWSPRRVSR